MRETLLRIKRGELNLFGNILNDYLPRIYYSVLSSKPSADVNNITVKIVSNLYDKISRYHFFINPNSFIDNSLTKIFKSYKMEYKKDFDEELEVPNEVMRNIFLKLSSTSHKKQKRSIMITVPLVVVVLSLSLVLYHQAFSEKQYFPKGSLVSNQTENINKISSTETSFFSGFRRVSGVVSIDSLDKNLTLLKFVDIEGDYSYKIYKGKEIISEFSIDSKLSYIMYGKNNTLIFKSIDQLVMIDFEGNTINTIETNSSMKFSDNYRYVLLQNIEKQQILFDIYNFKVIKEVNTDIAKVFNDGSLMAMKDLDALKEKHSYLNEDSFHSGFNDKYYVYLNTEGLLRVFLDTKIFFETNLEYFNYEESKQISNIFHFDISNDFIIVAFEGDVFCGVEAYDMKSNEMIIDIEDTISQGEMEFSPKISSDGERYLFSIQKSHYRDRNIRNLLLNLNSKPIKALRLDEDNYLSDAEVIIGNNNYYIYTLTREGTLEIFETK